ncbi:hepatocyte cell adhesion molecule [Salmo trutta]|uniref:hepatocyte cell adhesion molecule n=1 Tax=Salmo trutta TaxID=8032 RepID=UPI0011315939|nr:hepatocyte cell adhesion molecule-like [Salmo trutta]
MIPLIIKVLVVTAAAQVSATFCNLTEESGNHQCYGSVGESLSLHLTANRAEEKITLKKGDNRILYIKTGEDWRSKLHQDYVNRSEFLNNGTFRLDSVIEDDSGDYQLDIFNSEGTKLRVVNMQLEIQAPVSEPVLSHLCLHHGETMVTCSSERDGLQYSWTLNGQNLTRSVAYVHYQNTTTSVIILKSDVTGTLTCMVQNKVSSSNSTIHLLACPVFSSQIHFVIVTVAIALAVGTLVLLLAVFVGINRLCGKLRFLHTTSGCSNDEGAAVVYTEVFNKRKREVNQKATEMVEYGEIKMAASLNEEESPKNQRDMEMTTNQTYDTSFLTTFGRT